MIRESEIDPDRPATLPKLPAWIRATSRGTAEHGAFLSGASFALLDTILTQKDEMVPKALLSNTLALKVAVVTSKIEGRFAREQDIRDAYHLTPAGKARGPDGDMLAFWKRAVWVRVASPDWRDRLTDLVDMRFQSDISEWVERGLAKADRGRPMAAAVDAVKTVLKTDGRAERVACLVSDIVLAKCFSWDRPLPFTALHLTKAHLRGLLNGAEEPETSIHSALAQSAQTACRTAVTVSTSAQALRAVAPRLRARGSDDAVNLFLTEEAVAPSGMLSPYVSGTGTPMTGRAARQLCDRLVEFGVIKELMGRSTFRLYGVAA